MSWVSNTCQTIDTVLERHGTRVVLLLGSVALLLLLAPHWGMWLSNSDDPWITRQSLPEVLQTASAQGRFWLIPINLLAQLPYKAGSWELANLIKILVNGATVAAFVAFCSKATDLKTGLLVGCVWLAFIDVSPGYYSPFHGFLLMFNLQFAVMFLSFAWYLHKHSRGDGRVVVGPYLLFAFSLLAYEPMLFYAGLFPALAWMREDAARRTLRALPHFVLTWLRQNFVLVLVVLGYIGVYYAYRYFQPAPGRSIDFDGTWQAILKTIYRFSIYGFHLETAATKSYVAGYTLFSDLQWAVVYGLLLAGCFAVLMPRVHFFEAVAVPQRYGVLLLIAFYIFVPNVLHGFVESYRQWAADDPHYVGNYISSFALALLLAVLLILLAGSERARREPALYVLCTFLVFSSAVDNHLRWRQLSSINRADAVLWQKAIADLLRGALAASDKPLLICGKHSPERVSGDDRYWSDSLSEQLGRRVQFRSKNLQSVACDVTIEFNDYRF